uniref:Uncharacterized protein LOC111118202 n=1 Tax=Crassostrea virginica TaxID=6565 RepID=A0A8B8CDK6_CRAVI|nr:uncharacterized protein LOC111118202 [Crassostrea virginica]
MVRINLPEFWVMGTLLSRPKAKNQSTRKDVRSAKRPDNPDYGVLALIHKKASKPKKTKPLIDARPEKGKISIAKMYEQRYRPAFSGVDKQAYCDLFQKNPVPKVPAKVEVGLVFKVKKSALNINPFVEADTTPCIKERRLSIMGNNPDLLNISRHFQTRKHPSNRNLIAKY